MIIRKKYNIKGRYAILAAAAVLAAPPAFGAEIDTGNSDVKIRWDNTFNLSTAYRVKGQSSKLIGSAVGGNNVDFGANQDDGDRNFDKGIISKRVDWLSELEIGTLDYGVRLSGAVLYDDVYNNPNDNDSPRTSNHQLAGLPTNKFSNATKRLHGRDAEVRDAFAWSKFDVGEMPATVRFGRHALVYGETVFFGDNGIADAQGPIDRVKMLTVPSTQYKNVLEPVEQISGNIQVNPNVSLGAYYQLKWHDTKIPGAGSYFSTSDYVGAGSEHYISTPGTSGSRHTADATPEDSGQFGAQVRFAPGDGDWQFGVYGARYHAKTPSAMYNETFINPGGGPVPTSYRWLYAQNIKTVGASASTSVGQVNLAVEASTRFDAPLNSDPQANIGAGSLGTGAGNNSSNPLYAMGRTGHLNLSGITVLEPSGLWDGGSIVGEVGFNRTLKVTKNRSALDPNTTTNAGALRMIFTPAYFQVLPGMDVEVPMGLGYNFYGRSSALANFNGGSSNAGDFSLGVKATYQSDWEFGLNYVGYFGKTGTYLETLPTTAGAQLSFDQPLKDRDFITLNVKHAF